jgi:hypothetical protein
MEMEAKAAKPMYEMAALRPTGRCVCGCRLPVTVIVWISEAAVATADLTKAKMKVQKLGDQITVIDAQ